MDKKTNAPACCRSQRFAWIRFLLAAGLATLFAVSSQAGVTTRVEVSEVDGAGWGFLEEIPNGFGFFDIGPGVVPEGIGGIWLFVDPDGRMLFGSAQFAGLRFGDISNLGYSTYRTLPATGVVNTSLQFNVDYDLTDLDASWQGRLVYEPYYTETVTSDVWQTWDPMAGVWWGSGSPGNTMCPISSPCTWGEVLTNWPEAGVQAGALSGLLFKAGGPWATGFFGGVDAFTLGVMGSDTIYDFELITIFEDGFESGDAAAWTSSQGL